MTILIAMCLVIAFLMFPIEVVISLVGAAIAGLPGAIVGVIIGIFIDFARS